MAETAIPKTILEEVEEDLHDFSELLKKLDITVERPEIELKSTHFQNDFYYAFGTDLYNVRDLHIVLGNHMIFSPPPCPSRVQQSQKTREFFLTIAATYGLKALVAPEPQLQRNPVVEHNLRSDAAALNEKKLGMQLGGVYDEVWHRLTETEPLFDAANIARTGEELIYLVSSTGNNLGASWIKNQLADIKFIETDVYRSSHIDSTIIPISGDTLLVNASRVTPNSHVMEQMKDKRIIYFSEVANIPAEEIQLHERRRLFGKRIESLGLHTNLTEMSSPWAGMNVLVLKSGVIAVESRQKVLIETLEAHGFEVFPVRYRHPYTMLGGLHCSTLDLVRTS